MSYRKLWSKRLLERSLSIPKQAHWYATLQGVAKYTNIPICEFADEGQRYWQYQDVIPVSDWNAYVACWHCNVHRKNCAASNGMVAISTKVKR